MCDGMGWFSKNDFKRMLLFYDRIMYLVPSRTVEFRDVDGRPNYILISKQLQEVGFQFQHYEPNDAMAEAMIQSAKIDAQRPAFASIIAGIPEAERTYTWRITNADAGCRQSEHGPEAAIEDTISVADQFRAQRNRTRPLDNHSMHMNTSRSATAPISLRREAPS